MKVDWEAWSARSLADEDIVRLILDGTVVRTRLDKKATNISVLAALGVRRDGQKVLLAIQSEAVQKTPQWGVFPLNGRRKPVFDLATPHRGLASGFAGPASTLGPVPRRSRCTGPEAARIRHRRWRTGA